MKTNFYCSSLKSQWWPKKKEEIFVLPLVKSNYKEDETNVILVVPESPMTQKEPDFNMSLASCPLALNYHDNNKEMDQTTKKRRKFQDPFQENWPKKVWRTKKKQYKLIEGN